MAKYEQPTIDILYLVDKDVLFLSAMFDPVGNDKPWTGEDEL